MAWQQATAQAMTAAWMPRYRLHLLPLTDWASLLCWMPWRGHHITAMGTYCTDYTETVITQANDCMSKIRTVGQRIMAARSELGMTKTRHDQLSVRCSELASSFSTAQARLAAGQAPTRAAERELARLRELDAAHAPEVGCLINLLCKIQGATAARYEALPALPAITDAQLMLRAAPGA